MRALRRTLLRLAPARVIESAARRALRHLPGIFAIDELRVKTVVRQVPRLTVSIRVAAGHDAHAVCREAALAIYERLPPVVLRVLVAGEPPAGGRGQVHRFTSM